jgi:putative ABC transport system permease protein
MLRLAIANIYRPGALTPSVVMSLGLGLAVLVTITQIDGNLRRQFMAALPDRAPSFYFIDIPSTEADRFGAFLKQTAPQSTVEDVPMLRGRIVAARGVKAEDLKPSDRRRMGAAERPRPDLYRRNPQGLEAWSRANGGAPIMTGRRWSRSRRRSPTDSSSNRRPIVVNVLGRDITSNNRQHAHRGLAEPRHQFRAGVLAQRLQGRAAYPYRDPDRDPSGPRRRRPDHQGGGRCVSRW